MDRLNCIVPSCLLANWQPFFLLVIFFLLPLAWRFQPPLRLPVELEPAIAEGPVIFTIAFAAIYRELKGVYLWFTPLECEDRLYREFFWGLNEHKEMLIAIAMLFYALYRLPILKQIPLGREQSNPSGC